jgi:isopenicillin N synthase-like dioxygenase
MALMTVPVIDIAAFFSGNVEAKRKLVAAVNQACEDIGFWVMTGHGIEDELCKELLRVGRAFFDLPLEEKLKSRIDTSRQGPLNFSSRRGYLPVASEAFSYSRLVRSPGDLRESFSLGPIDVPADAYFHTEAARPHFAPNIWPERPAELKALCLEYYRRMTRLSEAVARICALALRLEEYYFEDKIDKQTSALLIHHYPDQPDQPLLDQLRTGAHSDLGMFTILRTEDEHLPGGLEVRNRAGQWVEVPAIPNSFVINIGDMMMRWTNDRWMSNMHRVLNPPREWAVGNHRMSVPFFYYPNYDSVVECLPNCSSIDNPAKYPKVTCGEYRMERILRVMNFARSQQAADETRPSVTSINPQR